MGVLDMRKQTEQAEKLKQIFLELTALIQLYQPTEAAVEAPFYGKDAQAMLKLGRAQGVAMVAMACQNLSIVEYSPRSVKQAVTGNGNASKEQVAQMLPHVLQGDIVYKFMDAADAAGVAFCHYLSLKTMPFGADITKAKTKTTRKKSDWGSFLADNPDRL